MILRLCHRFQYICSVVFNSGVRCFIYILLVASSQAYAQVGVDSVSTGENPETVVPSSPSEGSEDVSSDNADEDDELARVVYFRPKDVQVQNRYRPTENDSLFAKKWWRRLYAGVGGGFQFLSDNVSSVQNSHVAGYLGYRFTPVHSLRLHGTYTTFTYGPGKHLSSRSLGVGVDYLANISNFAWGYNQSRLVDVSTVLGVGTRINGARLSSKIAPYARLGAQVDFRLGSYFAFFAEPYVGVHKRMNALFDRPGREMWNLMYGVNVGMQMSLDRRPDQYLEADSIYRKFFFDSSIGVVVPGRAGGIMHRIGHGYHGALGVWLNPMFGLRLGAQAQSVRWSSEMMKIYGASVRRSNNQALFSGRLEMMVNPMNFSKRWRNKPGGHDFDFNFLVGGDFGWNMKSNVPNTTNGAFRCYYYGVTGAIQVMYRISKPGTYIFVEPRYLAAMYSVPYQNTRNSLFNVEHNFSFNVGTRLYMMGASQTGDDKAEFTPHWWAGLDVGGVKWQTTQSLSTGGLGINPTVGFSLGYDLSRYASFRAQLAYQRLYDTHTSSYVGYDMNENMRRGNGLWNSAYDVMDLRLSYMLNLNNLFQGYNSDRRFNLWWTVGPSLSYVFNQSDNWVEDQIGTLPSMKVLELGDSREGKASPAVHTSLMAALRVAPQYEVTVEALGQYNILPGLHPGRPGRLNSLKYGLTVGSRYHFEQDKLRAFLSGTEAKPWQRGWQFEASYGWALPLGTKLALHGSGSSLALSAGYWFNGMLGARFGLMGQQGYYQRNDVPAVVEPVSGTQVHAPYSVYYPQLMLGGRAEVMLNPLNFFRSRRELDEAPRWDMNLSAGLNFGAVGKAGGFAAGYVGLTTSAAVLYRLSDVTQLYLEPRFDLMSYSRYNAALNYDEPFKDKVFTVSVGARISRPTEKSAEDNVSTGAEPEEKAHRGLWAAVGFGGAKTIQHLRVSGGGASFQPSIGVSVGYDFTRLSSVRANFVYDMQSRLRPNQPYAVAVSGTPKRYTGTVNSKLNQLDVQLLYMLNLTNLWTGRDKRNAFNIYLEAGPVFSTITSQSNSLAKGELDRGTGFQYLGHDYSGKCSFSMAAGMLMALPVTKNWDVTAEVLGQYYVNRTYTPEYSPWILDGIKMNFSVGTRYHFNQDQLLDFFRGTDAKAWQKGWELNASYGWAFPLDTNIGLHGSGTSLSVSAGYWFNSILGARLGFMGQQTYYRKQDVAAVNEPISGTQVHAPYSVYYSQYMLGGRAELLLNPLNFIRSRRERDEAPRWDLNLSAGLNFGGLGKAGGLGMVGGYVGFTTSAALLYRLSNVTQLYLEPRYDVFSYSKHNASLDFNDSFADRMFAVSIGARITRPVEESSESKRATSPDKMAHRGLWLSAGVGGTKMLQRLRVGAKGMPIQPSVGLSVGYDFSRLSTARLSFSYDIQSRTCPNQPYTVTAGGVDRRFTGTINSTVHQLDMQLLYMLNITNLWTGYDKRNAFNIYLEAGPAYAVNLLQSNTLADGELMGGTNFRYAGHNYSGKSSFALASGVLMALPLNKHWDITAELLGHFYFKRGYMPEYSPQFLNGIKMNFSVGTRYNF